MQVLNGDWTVSDQLILAGDTKVVTIKGDNPGSEGGILASFSNGVLTDGTWQCADMSLCISVECENSVIWQDAQTYGVNENNPRPWNRRIADIESTAKWIWVDDKYARKVWCKKTFGKLEIAFSNKIKNNPDEAIISVVLLHVYGRTCVVC